MDTGTAKPSPSLAAALAGAEIAVAGGALGVVPARQALRRARDGQWRGDGLGALGEVFLGLLLAAAPDLQKVHVLGLGRAEGERLARRLGDPRIVLTSRPSYETTAVVHLGVSGALSANPARVRAILERGDEALAALRTASRAVFIDVGSVLASGGQTVFGERAERAFLERVYQRGAGHGAEALRWRAQGMGFAAAGAWAQSLVAAAVRERVAPARLTRVDLPFIEPSVALPEAGFTGRSTALAPLVWALGSARGTLRELPCNGALEVPILPMDLAAGMLVAIVAHAVSERQGGTFAPRLPENALTWHRLVELTNLAARPATAARGWNRIWESMKATEARVVAPLPTEAAPLEGPWEPMRAGPSRAGRALLARYGSLLTTGFPAVDARAVAAVDGLMARLDETESALLRPPFAWRPYWFSAYYPGLASRAFQRFERRHARREPLASGPP